MQYPLYPLIKHYQTLPSFAVDCDLSSLNSWDLCGSFVCEIEKKLNGRKNKAHLKILTTKINDSAKTNLTASSTKWAIINVPIYSRAQFMPRFSIGSLLWFLLLFVSKFLYQHIWARFVTLMYCRYANFLSLWPKMRSKRRFPPFILLLKVGNWDLHCGPVFQYFSLFWPAQNQKTSNRFGDVTTPTLAFLS